MDAQRKTLRMYGQPSPEPRLDWDWVVAQLREAGTYWVSAVSAGHPHPRPVWGVWHRGSVSLSIGSPVIRAQLAADPRATVHLPSGSDVVVVEGNCANYASTPDDVLDAYQAKYGRGYDVTEFGQLSQLAPSTVIAWRVAGWAGQGGFQERGKWTFTALNLAGSAE
jgi:hypothetical protein